MKSRSTPVQQPTTIRITERDLALFEALSSYRVLSTAQVAALFTPSYDSARRLLRRLYQAKLIVRVFQPVVRSSFARESIWALSRRGAMEVSRSRDCSLPSYLSTKDQKGNLSLDHTLARNDFRICFEKLDTLGELELVAWRQSKEELRCHSELRGPLGGLERVTLIADGYLEVRRSGRKYHMLLEADMGTTSQKRMSRKYQAYWSWWKNGGHGDRFGASNIRVLTVTTTYQRLGNLRNLALEAPATSRGGTGLFWFTTLAHVDVNAPRELLENVWWSSRSGENNAIQLFNYEEAKKTILQTHITRPEDSSL